MQMFWEEGTVQQYFKYFSIVYFYQSKGNTATCNNHKGIYKSVCTWKDGGQRRPKALTRQLPADVISGSECGFRRTPTEGEWT